MDIKIKEYDIKVILLKEIHLKNIGSSIGGFLTEILCIDENWKKMHYNKEYKGYCFNYLHPQAQNKIYQRGVYNFQVRVIDEYVESILDNYISGFWNDTFKVIFVKKSELTQKRNIQRCFTVTPVILKTDKGYWRKENKFELFESRIKSNMIKKYKFITGETIEEEPQIYNKIILDNEKPVATSYKNIILLGDKITIELEQDNLSQEIAFITLGMGVGENNSSIGAGFLNYKY